MAFSPFINLTNKNSRSNSGSWNNKRLVLFYIIFSERFSYRMEFVTYDNKKTSTEVTDDVLPNWKNSKCFMFVFKKHLKTSFLRL